MTIDLLGQGFAQAHEHGRPDDGVEADDFLADEVNVARPIFIVVVILVVQVTQGGDIVAQSVHPDVDHMTGIEGDGDAPGEAGAADAEVFQAGLDEVVHHLIAAALRFQETGLAEQFFDLLLVLGETEEIGFLLGVLYLTAAVGTLAVHQLGVGPEGLAGNAVFALVSALVDVAVVVHLFKNFLDALHMIIIGGADEAVVGDVHQLPQILDAALAADHVVHELLGGDAGGLGLLFDLQAVFIGTGQKQHVIAAHSLVACHGVGGHGAVGVTDVQLVRGVINGGCDIKLFCHCRSSSFVGAAEWKRATVSLSSVLLVSGKRAGSRRPRCVGIPGACAEIDTLNYYTLPCQ